jgi:hypothetical protein
MWGSLPDIGGYMYYVLKPHKTYAKVMCNVWLNQSQYDNMDERGFLMTPSEVCAVWHYVFAMPPP